MSFSTKLLAHLKGLDGYSIGNIGKENMYAVILEGMCPGEAIIKYIQSVMYAKKNKPEDAKKLDSVLMQQLKTLKY